MQRLINFFDPLVRGLDERGRSLDEILNWNDRKLDKEHDYIQTLFPLPEKSNFSLVAPVLDEETVVIFHKSPDLKARLIRAVKRILLIYGFEAQVKEGTSDRLLIATMETEGNGWARWLTASSHNHRRITRIIRSLRILGLPGVAWDVYRAFVTIYKFRGVVERRAVAYWTRALRDPVFMSPDGIETNWLRRYRMGCPVTGPWCWEELRNDRPFSYT